MTDDELKRKQEKAQVYATQPERFELLEIHLKMHSSHGLRQISYQNGTWNCTCEFFKQHSTCSHTMAAERILKNLLPKAQ